MEELRQAPAPNPLRAWTVADVGAFLADLRLEEYVAGVAENEVDGHTLLELVAVDGLSDFGVTKLHAIRIKRALEKAASEVAQVPNCSTRWYPFEYS
jgi:hypothetical protein